MEEKKDPLGLLEEIPSPEAPFLPNVGQRRRVVNPPQDRRLARRCRKDLRQEDPQSKNFPHTED
jgi:hypothetical protein